LPFFKIPLISLSTKLSDLFNMHSAFLNFDQNAKRMESAAKIGRFIKLPQPLIKAVWE